MSTSISTMGSGTAATASASFGAGLSAALSSEEQVLALVVFSQSSRMAEAKTTIDLSSEQLEKLREEVKKALEDAMAAEKESGFWGGLADLFGSDLASIAVAVAAVAATVASGGAAAAILAVVAAAATIAAEHAEELGIPVEVAMVIAVAASVAGLCCGNAGALFKVSKTVEEVATTVKLAATGTALAFKAEGALFDYASSRYEHEASHRHADVRGLKGEQELVSIDIDEALERFSAAIERQNDAVQTTSQIQRQDAASRFTVLSNFGGAA